MFAGNTLTLAVIVAALVSIRAAQSVPAPSAAVLLDRAIASQGGAALESSGPITLDAIGHQMAQEQSERPEGPWNAYLQAAQRDPRCGAQATLWHPAVPF